MLTAYSRVTVVTPDRSVDLALPSALPLSEVLPQLMHFVAPDGTDGVPATWALGKVGGASLLLSQTLAEAGVLDGDVLELRAGQDEVRAAVVEDVRDAVEDSVDASGGVWTTLTTASFAVVTASVVLGSLALATLAAAGVRGDSWLDRTRIPGHRAGSQRRACCSRPGGRRATRPSVTRSTPPGPPCSWAPSWVSASPWPRDAEPELAPGRRRRRGPGPSPEAWRGC